MIALLLLACAGSGGETHRASLAHGDYWLHIPDDLPAGPAPALVFLHANGDGEAFATDPEMQQELSEAGLIGVFPMGGGEPGDDWRVGRNKDHIPRDDRAFLDAVANDIAQRDDIGRLWLGGHSKGGSMTDDYGCLAGGPYAGYLPLAGAFEDWVPDPCTGPPRPIRHLQGRTDDHWPRETADKPDSSHKGIVESLRAMQHNAACMDEDPVWERDCEVWAGCDLDIRLCWHDGGHGRPPGWMAEARDWMDQQP